jgi:hypothetical protein
VRHELHDELGRGRVAAIRIIIHILILIQNQISIM